MSPTILKEIEGLIEVHYEEFKTAWKNRLG